MAHLCSHAQSGLAKRCTRPDSLSAPTIIISSCPSSAPTSLPSQGCSLNSKPQGDVGCFPIHILLFKHPSGIPCEMLHHVVPKRHVPMRNAAQILLLFPSERCPSKTSKTGKNRAEKKKKKACPHIKSPPSSLPILLFHESSTASLSLTRCSSGPAISFMFSPSIIPSASLGWHALVASTSNLNTTTPIAPPISVLAHHTGTHEVSIVPSATTVRSWSHGWWWAVIASTA
jgi:hypothetical protein